MADYLATVAPQLPPALVDAAARRRIEGLAAQLPGLMSSFFGYECPLGSTPGRPDFLLCATRIEGHAAVIAGTHPVVGLPIELAAAPGWRSVCALAHAWADVHDRLGDDVLNLWLEFDIGRDDDALLTPGLFFAPTAHTPKERLRGLLARLAPEAVVGERDAALARFLDDLPRGTRVFQVGVLPSRGEPWVRLCVRGLGADDLVPALGALGWPGDTAPVADFVAATAAVVTRYDLDFDLGASLAPRLGLECAFGTERDTLARLARFTDVLQCHDLCTPAQAAALAAWHGLSHQDAPGNAWPAHLRALAREAGSGVASCLRRWLHHVKLGFAPAQPLAAKAYLGIEHLLLDDARLRAHLAAAGVTRQRRA